jgi:hypothetical protein
VANHHRHVHHKEDEPRPTSKLLRKFAAPIILFIILVYAAQWAFHFVPRTDPRNLAAGILFAGAATFLWILKPWKER